MFKNNWGISRTPVKADLGHSVKKINDSLLSFVVESSILDSVVVLDPSLDVYFMLGVNSLFIKFLNIT